MHWPMARRSPGLDRATRSSLYLINADSLSFANGVLTVMNGTTPVESLPMSGNYSADNFRMTYNPGAQFSNLISYVADPVASGPTITSPERKPSPPAARWRIDGVSVAGQFRRGQSGFAWR